MNKKKTRGSVVAALLQQPDVLKNAYEDAMNAEGSALKENEKYLESIQGRIDLFNNAVQTMWSNAINDDFIKFIINAGTQLVKFIDNVGVLKTAFIGLGTYFLKKSGIGGIGDLFNTSSQNLEKLKKNLDSAKASYEKNPSARNKKKLDSAQGLYDDYKNINTNKLKEVADAEKEVAKAREALSIAEKNENGGFSPETIELYREDLDSATEKLKNLKIAQGDLGKGKQIWAGLKSGAKAFGAQVKLVVKDMLTMYAITAAFEVITKLFSWASEGLNDESQSVEALQEKFEELNSDLSTCKSEIRSLESELDTTQDKIDELMAKGKLSFTEQEELQRLQNQNDELKQQIELRKTLQKTLQERTNAASINATNKYLTNTSFGSEQSKTERQEESKEKWGTIGKAIGLTAGAILAGIFTGGVGAVLVGAGAGALIGGTAGEIGGSAYASFSYDSEQSVGDAIKNMQAERQKLVDAQNEALANSADDPEAYTNATEALEKYDEQMAKHISLIQENYNAMDWKTANDEQKKAMREQADMLSAYSITMGDSGAISTTLNRIFGAEASDEIKAAKQKYIEALNDGKEITLEEAFGSDSEAFEELKQRFYDMGIYIVDATNYLKDFKKAEDEAAETDLYDIATQMSAVSKGIKALKDAFNEVVDSGTVAADTIISLNETFGSIEGISDEWQNYVNVMMSGIATTDEMTEATRNLVEAFIDNKLSKDWTPEEKTSVIAQLMSLGVTNAAEWVNDAEAEKGYTEIAKAIKAKQDRVNTLTSKPYDELTDDEKEELTKLQNDLVNPEQADWILEIANTYGIENDALKANIQLLKDKAQAEQDLKNATDNQSDYNTWLDNYNKALEKVNTETEDVKKYKELFGDIDMSAGHIRQQLSELGWIEQTENPLTGETSFVKDGKKITDDDIANYKKAIEEQNKIIAEAEGEIKRLQDEALKKGWATLSTSGEWQLKENTPEEIQKAIDEAQAVIDDATNKIETEITAEIQMEINLKDASAQVDKIQSVFDTLVNAEKEYNSQGYFSVDTLQSLLDMSPEYLALLYNEQGQLELNRDALLKVAKARIIEQALVKLQAIGQEALTNATSGSIEEMNQQITATEEASGTLEGYVATQRAAIQSALDLRVAQGKLTQEQANTFLTGIDKQMNAIVSSTQSTLNRLSDAISTSGSSATDSALEKLQKRYEHQISNLDNQQTYLQNEIDRLEAEHQGVSKQYYEDQIAIEQQKLNLYQQERSELLDLLNDIPKGTDKWYEVSNAIWETEHNIQESTLKMVEFRQSIIDLYKTVFDDLANAHSNKDDFLSDQQNYIDKYLELLDLQGEVASASGYQEQIAIEQKKMENNVAQLNNLRELLADGMSTGDIKEDSEEWINMQDQIREVEAAILDNKIALEEYNNELKNLSVEAFNLVRDAFSNKDNFFTTQQDYIEGYIDYLEAIGVDVPKAIYEKLIEIEKEKRNNNLTDLIDARQGLQDIEKAGYTAADEEWQDAYSQVTALEKKIQDSDIAMAQWAQTIRELDFDKFDRFISRLDDLNSEIEHLRGLMNNEDVALEDGTWTKEGITSLGLLYQQMQLNQQKSQEYAQKIEELNKAYSKGSMSEQEYYEQLQELKEGQWDAIEAYEDAKDSIVDMEEARIDMIEEGINKEIDAYEELISLKKKELDAERDLFDFKKNIEKQTKDITSLQRRLSSLSGSTDAADIAERRKLEAQLRDAQEELNDTYYSHAKDAQSEALDDEMDAYQKSREDYLKTLRDALEDTQAIIDKKISEFLSNVDTGLNTLNATAEEHNLTLSDSLMKPWQNASTESIAFKSTVNSEVEQIKQIVLDSTSPLTANLRFPWDGVIGEDGPINTFSKKSKSAIDGAVISAQNNAGKMKNNLASPWNDGVTAINTWSNTVENAYNKAIKKAEDSARAINSANQSINPPSYYSGDSYNDPGSKVPTPWVATDKFENIEQASTVMYANQNQGIYADGWWYYPVSSKTKKYGYVPYARRREKLPSTAMWTPGEGTTLFKKRYAKGTIGTKKDQWAITDEPQWGDELTLIPGKDGNLSFMRKGTGVVPAKLTERIMELAMQNPPDMSGTIVKPVVSNVETTNQAISVNFESLVKADNITNDVLPEVEKMVSKQLENFTRQLNYSIKRYK